MADFYAENPLIFDVPNDNPFYADPAAVFVKNGGSVLAHPSHPAPFEKHSTSELVHPSAVSLFIKSISSSPAMARERNVAG